MAASHTDAKYWREYSNLQHEKHALIEEYLKGWFPKLALGQWGSSRIIYIDTHAGRGRHRQGQPGSPLIALNTLLNHNLRDRLLARCEVKFLFVELDEENVDHLNEELEQIGGLPKNVNVSVETGDSFKLLDELLTSLEEDDDQLAPAFIFLDPYGFKIPGHLLRRLMGFSRVELFINVIWRELGMAIAQGGEMPQGMADTLDLVFDNHDWRDRITSSDFNERGEQCVDLYREVSGAKWATYIRMLIGKKTRYFLVHLSNHDAGREYMKECVFKVCPDGGYYAQKTDNAAQQLLIQPEQDLGPVREWVLEMLSDGPMRWQDLIEEVLAELWLRKHLNSVIRQLRKDGEIIADQYKKTFHPCNNPRLRLADD